MKATSILYLFLFFLNPFVLNAQKISNNTDLELIELLNIADSFSKKASLFKFTSTKKVSSSFFNFQTLSHEKVKEDNNTSSYLIYLDANNHLHKINQRDSLNPLNNRDFYFYYSGNIVFFYCYQYRDLDACNGDWIDGVFFNLLDKSEVYFVGMNESYVDEYSYESYEVENIFLLNEDLFPTKQLKLSNGEFVFKSNFHYEQSKLDYEVLSLISKQAGFNKVLNSISLEELRRLFAYSTYCVYIAKVKPDIVNKGYPVWLNTVYKYE